MGRQSNIPILYDFCKSLSTTDLKQWKYLKPNQIRSGIVTMTQWGNEFELSIKVVSRPVSPYIVLNYSIDENEINYQVNFELLSSNLGKGYVWYFLCPCTGIRCSKLYLIGSYFCHRSAYKSGFYQTQTLGTKDKFLIRQFDKLQKANKAKIKLHSKYFKRYYNDKPTKQYLKLLEQIEAGSGISESELLVR